MAGYPTLHINVITLRMSRHKAFLRRSRAKTAKKYTKKCDSRSKLMSCLLNLLFYFYFLVAVASLDLGACLQHEGGGPRVGEVTCDGLPHLTCKRDHIKMRDHMDRRVTPPHLHVNRPLLNFLMDYLLISFTFL